MDIFDVAIIGAGVAGSFAAYKLAKDFKNVKCIIFDIGRPPLKRRSQMCGWLGCLPNSDGRLFINDLDKVSNIIGKKKTKSNYNDIINLLSNISKFNVIKDNSPNPDISKKIKDINFDIELNDHMQMYPKDIHTLSRNMSELIEEQGNIKYSFDNEVLKILRKDDCYYLTTEQKEYCAKKILVCTGRSGWRWANNLFNEFGIIESNDIAKFGIRVEMNTAFMKDYNHSMCSLIREDLEIGPLNWNGTVIPEDHVDMAISAFRANENRWKTEKVSFSLIGTRHFEGNGSEQINRIGCLTFILSNDRIIREKVSTLVSGKSKISVMKEYDWLKDSITELTQIMPDIATKAYFHIPTIVPFPAKININSNLSTDMDNMFVAGENAGVRGLLSAMIFGFHAANEIVK